MKTKAKKIWVTVLIIGVLCYAGLKLIGSTQVPPVYIIAESVVIDAPPQRVWDLLMAVEKYPQWNPYLVKIEGDLTPGQQVVVTLVDANFPEPLTVSPTVKAVEPLQRFYWEGKALTTGIADTRHFFVLQQRDNGTTHFFQYEEFRGLVPMLLPGREGHTAKTRAAFAAMHDAMRAQLETGT